MLPSTKTAQSVKENLSGVLKNAKADERQVDGITLVADDSLFSWNPGFKECFLGALDQVLELGYQPRVILQRCENSPESKLSHHSVEYWRQEFLTTLNLHRLLVKKIDN